MRDDQLAPTSARPLEDRLDSWKEIAAYLGRGVRTVQRWEREEGLPVHRLPHDKRGSIYARRDELSAWWESRQQSLMPPSASPSISQPAEAVPASRLDRVTRTIAITSWPALSSDARLVAYVSDTGEDGMAPQIWTQQIGGAALRLTNRQCQYSHLSFSPEDTTIVFTARDDSGTNVYEIPTLGGDARLLHRGSQQGRVSPDGRWFACVPQDGVGVRIAARAGAGFRTIATALVDVESLAWSPDSRFVVVHARTDPAHEPDWLVVPVDGGSPVSTGVNQRFRQAGMFVIPTGVAWAGDALVFAAAGSPLGVHLYRQRLAASTFQPMAAPERLTTAGESAAWLPAAAGGRLAYFSSRADSNLWSVPLDASTGVASGPPRRISRGPFPLGYLTLTRDGQTLAYFSFRLGRAEIFVRDLQSGVEKPLADEPAGERGYPAISPDGRLLAYGTKVPGGARAVRPIFVAELPDGPVRSLGDDCGGRPREWVDERHLVIERYARLHSIALIHTVTGNQHELLQSAERSISNPRLSPDRRWIAFDASLPGGSASVFVAPFRLAPIDESTWIEIERAASHPFWSDGRRVYYTPVGTNPSIRSAVRARPFDSASGRVEGESILVFESMELLMPAYLPGTGPVATSDQILLVLGDFRGDIWIMDFE